MLSGMGRSRAWLLVGAFVVSGATAIACGTSNGDAGTPGVDDPPEDTTDNGTKPPSRPAFEAGFADEDAGDGGGTTTPEAGTPCNDPADPGGTTGTARALPPTDDCDNNVKPVQGVLSTPVDVDVYKLSTTDKTFCSTDTQFPMSTAGVQLCVYVHCTNAGVSTTNVTGCTAGQKATDKESGWEGCCVVGPGDPAPAYDCAGVTDDDSADFVLRVSATQSTKDCQAYSFGYEF